MSAPGRGMTAPTTLYRMRDASGRLLYVGISDSFVRRLAQHQRRKDWWSEIASVALTHYPTRSAAEKAERDAIKSERPLHNITHAPRTAPMPALCSIDSVARFLGVPKSTVRKLVRTHGMPCQYWKGTLRFSDVDVLLWLADNPDTVKQVGS